MPYLLSRRVVVSLPPMYAWPRPLKVAVFGLGVALCVGAYLALGAGLVTLASVVMAE